MIKAKNAKFVFVVSLLLIVFLVGCSQTVQQTAPIQQLPSEVPKQEAVQEQPQQSADNNQETPENEAVHKTIAVSIKSFKFVPSDLNVNVGDTVVWTNEDSAAHTVESNDGTLESDELSKGDTYKFTFTKAGKYSYICGIHPSMKGSVMVQ